MFMRAKQAFDDYRVPITFCFGPIP
ncbi:hypothetical protein NQ317_005388 [Molorchus minor]|uniref:Uncharacterized protein n=1 Tax=Molorchus minor TaxID=1323400 RepID=A0ABQ9IQM5_9CUCU|nr:hypothetical protein NQ317_005388 [Molorchus minor]